MGFSTIHIEVPIIRKISNFISICDIRRYSSTIQFNPTIQFHWTIQLNRTRRLINGAGGCCSSGARYSKKPSCRVGLDCRIALNRRIELNPRIELNRRTVSSNIPNRILDSARRTSQNEKLNQNLHKIMRNLD